MTFCSSATSKSPSLSAVMCNYSAMCSSMRRVLNQHTRHSTQIRVTCLKRLLWFPRTLSLHQFVRTQRFHNSQNAVIGYRLRCPYSENVLTSLNSRVPKVMLFGQIKGSNPPDQPSKICNDIVLSDFHQLNIRRPYCDAHDQPAWQDKTCVTHT